MARKSKPPVLNTYSVIALWLLLIAVCTLIFTKVLSERNNPNQQLKVQIAENGTREIVLKQNHYGHYLATGYINNIEVTFFVDTGASFVAIPEHLSEKLALKKGTEFQSSTANGLSQSYYTTVELLKLGDIEMKNVPASIGTGMDFDEVLLGMSFLKHLTITQNANELIISLPE